MRCPYVLSVLQPRFPQPVPLRDQRLEGGPELIRILDHLGSFPGETPGRRQEFSPFCVSQAPPFEPR